MRQRSASTRGWTAHQTPSCPADDGVPGCATGPLGRLRWVIAELITIFRGDHAANGDQPRGDRTTA